MSRTWKQLEAIQPKVLKMLKNSILKDRVSHAYLFEGLRGTGKREVGLLLAKSLFCQSPMDDYLPCNECSNCKRIETGNHPDFHFIEPDGLSIKKQQIHALQEEFSKTGVESKQKIYMIFHADRMTTNAANSLLKFLEEPNKQTYAILISEQVQKILPTILSRCQIITFSPLSPKNLIDKFIIEGVEPSIAPLLAQLTNNVEEALALNGDDWFAQARKIVVKLFEVLKKNSLEAMVSLQDNWYVHFKEKEQLDRGLDLLLLIFKDLLYIQLGKQTQVVFQTEMEKLQQYALQTSGPLIADNMAVILEAKRKLQANMNTQLLMEQLVLKLQEGSTVV